MLLKYIITNDEFSFLLSYHGLVFFLNIYMNKNKTTKIVITSSK